MTDEDDGARLTSGIDLLDVSWVHINILILERLDDLLLGLVTLVLELLLTVGLLLSELLSLCLLLLLSSLGLILLALLLVVLTNLTRLLAGLGILYRRVFAGLLATLLLNAVLLIDNSLSFLLVVSLLIKVAHHLRGIGCILGIVLENEAPLIVIESIAGRVGGRGLRDVLVHNKEAARLALVRSRLVDLLLLDSRCFNRRFLLTLLGLIIKVVEVGELFARLHELTLGNKFLSAGASTPVGLLD